MDAGLCRGRERLGEAVRENPARDEQAPRARPAVAPRANDVEATLSHMSSVVNCCS